MMKEVMDPLFFIHQVVGEAASQVAVVNTARQVSRAATHVYLWHTIAPKEQDAPVGVTSPFSSSLAYFGQL